jgi:hypothetical protein
VSDRAATKTSGAAMLPHPPAVSGIVVKTTVKSIKWKIPEINSS